MPAQDFCWGPRRVGKEAGFWRAFVFTPKVPALIFVGVGLNVEALAWGRVRASAAFSVLWKMLTHDHV